jgi:hypothetical protein
MATAEAAGESWHITRRGFWRRVLQATDRGACGGRVPRAWHAPRRHAALARPRACAAPGKPMARALLLFSAFVVRGLSADASSAAGAG